MGSGIVIMNQNTSCQLARGFCQLHPEASTELHGTMQNSHFHHTSENGLTVLPENDGVT
jgi:hypothetical protein